MIRIDQRYFRTLVWPFLAVLVILAIAGYFLLRDIEISNHRTMLHKLITFYTLSDHPDIQTLHKQSHVRITLIDANGTVTAESNRNPIGMENHRHRPEIIQARRDGFGSAVRHSATLDRDMLYVAYRDGNHYVRMAYPLSIIQEKFIPLWLEILTLFGLALGSALWVATRINRQVSRDVQRINTSLEHLLKKEYRQVATRIECCEELETISRQINKVADKLKKREHQKNKYTKKLKHLTRQQSEIISAISHEFKNPVAAIIGYAGTIHDDPELSQALREKFLEKVIRNGERISEMIDRLSLAIKMENGTLEARKEPIDLSIILNEVVENLQQKYPERTLNVFSEARPIQADRVMMTQVMSNLIDNALKYSEEPVTITLKDGQFIVEDHGIGIEADAIDKITRRFYRVDTQSWDNSLGVGLSIVAYILELHNTKLEIKSIPGEGSSFGFSLPLDKQQ